MADKLSLSEQVPSLDEFMQMRETLRQQFGLGPFDPVPSPSDPRQEYDYLEFVRNQSAFQVDPTDQGRLHASSEFKSPTHPNRFKDLGRGLTDTITGRSAFPMSGVGGAPGPDFDIFLRNLSRVINQGGRR
jgi:hypothetical protein